MVLPLTRSFLLSRSRTSRSIGSGRPSRAVAGRSRPPSLGSPGSSDEESDTGHVPAACSVAILNPAGGPGSPRDGRDPGPYGLVHAHRPVCEEPRCPGHGPLGDTRYKGARLDGRFAPAFAFARALPAAFGEGSRPALGERLDLFPSGSLPNAHALLVALPPSAPASSDTVYRIPHNSRPHNALPMSVPARA